MKPNLPLILAFISTLTTSTLSGMFLIKEKDNISFSKADNNEKFYIIILIYSVIFTFIYACYYGIYLLLYGLGKCCDDNPNPQCYPFNFTIYNLIFTISGILALIYIFFHAVLNKYHISKSMNLVTWLLIGNFIFIFLIVIINKIYNTYYNKSEPNYREL